MVTYISTTNGEISITYMVFAWYTYAKKKNNCTYIYKFVFLYLQLLNLIPY